MTRHDKNGREVPDPTPVAIPLAYRGGETIEQKMQRFIRQQLSQRAAEAQHETFEEADDFDVDEDPELTSPYEIRDAVPEFIAERDPSPPPEPGKGKPVEEVATPPLTPKPASST